jgi:lipopolysaccharide heptosyltransferase I
MPAPPTDLTQLEPRRICIVKPSSLGDVVHAFPVLHALRARWPEARISWVINRSLRGLVDGHPEIDEVIPYDRGRAGFTPGGVQTVFALLDRLRRGRFDLTIDLQGLLRSGLMTAATMAPTRAGLRGSREGAFWFYTRHLAGPIGSCHEVDRLLQVAEAFGADVSRPRCVLAVSDQDREWARRVLEPVPRPRIVLNPGARWITKRWPPEHFAEVGRRAVAELGAGLVGVGADEDRPLIDSLRQALNPIRLLDLRGQTSLPQLAALAAEADLFVSNDTGPLHLAAAADARVIGIFTCTDPGRTGPYGDRARVVSSKIWCAASYLKTCERLDCMTELTPARVWRVVREELESGLAARAC